MCAVRSRLEALEKLEAAPRSNMENSRSSVDQAELGETRASLQQLAKDLNAMREEHDQAISSLGSLTELVAKTATAGIKRSEERLAADLTGKRRDFELAMVQHRDQMEREAKKIIAEVKNLSPTLMAGGAGGLDVSDDRIEVGIFRSILSLPCPPLGIAWASDVASCMSCCTANMPDTNAVEIDHVVNVDEAVAKNEPSPAGPTPPDTDVVAVAEDFDDEMPIVEVKKDLVEEPKTKNRPPMASICKLFSMMDAKEVVILIVGIIGGIGNGISQPLLCIVFGDLIDSMGISMSGNAAFSANMTSEAMAQLEQQAMDSMMSKMEELCLIMALVGVGNIVAASLQGACFKIFSELQARKFRIEYFDIVLHQDVTWFDLKEVAALPAEINDDLEKIADAFGDKFGNGIMALSAFLGGFACAFGLGWLVALVMCSILPFMGVGAALMGKAVQEVQMESQSWYAKASAVVEECLFAMRTVVAFGGERKELDRFGAALVQARRGGVKNGFKIGAGMGYTMCVIFLGYALAFYYGMILRYNDEINPSTGELWQPGTIMAIFFCIFIGATELPESLKILLQTMVNSVGSQNPHDKQPRALADWSRLLACEQVEPQKPPMPVPNLGGNLFC
eukprot:symbB.v1.2.005301.t1/scaffold283.1/size308953/2